MRQSGKISDLSTWLTKAKVSSGHTADTTPAAPTLPKIKSVKLQFDSIKCEDTDEFFGEDRIITGGMGFDSAVQGIHKVGKFRLNSNRPQGTFAQGTATNFTPDVKFVEFPLGTGGFPRFIQANVLLFEEDNGGAADLLQALWDSVGTQLTSLTVSITAAITGAAITGAISGTSIGAAVGSAIPGLGTAVGAIAGAVAGIVLGALIAALMSWLKDDLLGDPDEPVAPFLILESATERFSNNSLKSPVETLEFRNPDSN